MKGCRYAFEVERFVLFAGSDAHAPDHGPRLELDASIVSDVAIERVRLVSPNLVIPIAINPQADDDDPRLRLSLRETVSQEAGHFEAADLEIDAANGDRLAFGVGHLFRPPGWMPVVVAFAGCPDALPVAVPNADALAHAVADGFAALAECDDLFMHRGDEGWIATSHRYGLHFATSLDIGLDRAEACEQAWPLFQATTTGLQETLAHGAPLVVHRATSTDTDETMTSLFDALRARNPDAVLLWLDPYRADSPVVRHRAGAATPPAPGLLVASAGLDWTTLLRQARDTLVAPR